MGELRLDNFGRAKKNAEFVSVELDRIEGKIQALAEMAVNRQDPDFLSSQVDSAAESMRQTEKAVSELQHLTGLGEQLEEPPAILETDLRGGAAAMMPECRRRAGRSDLPRLVPGVGVAARGAVFLRHDRRVRAARQHLRSVSHRRRRTAPRYGVLAEFLAEQLFGRWSLVLHYDLGRGPARVRRTRRAAAQGDGRARQQAGRRPQRAAEGSGRDVRAARSLRAQQHHGGRGRSAQRRGDHRPGVVRVPVAASRAA